MDNYTRIPNTLIKDGAELEPKELLIATIVLTTLNSKGICTFNLQTIYDILHIKDNNTRAKKEIRDILNLFKQTELFKFYDSIFLINEIDIDKVDKNTIIFALYIEVFDAFTKIKDGEIYKIIEYSKNNKVDTSLLLNTLIYILSFINENKEDENYKLSFPTLLNIAENVGITEKSVLKYINILKDINILIFDYAGIKETRDGKVKNGNMYYARVGNEQELINKLNREREAKGYIKLNKLNKDKINLKRKLKQEINYLNKKDELTLVELNKLNILNVEYKKLCNE